MNPTRFTFEVNPLYKSMTYDTFSTLEALEQKPTNSWFLQLMCNAAKRFAPHTSELTDDTKAHSFVKGALATLEAFNDTKLDHETRRQTHSTVARKVLILATTPKPPDVVYANLLQTAQRGFASHQELVNGGVILVAHLVERYEDANAAEAGWAGMGFAGHLLGSTCQSYLVHPAAGIDVDQICADAMANFDQNLARLLTDGGIPPA